MCIVRSYDLQDPLANATFHTVSNNLPDDTDIKQETLDFMEEVEADLESPEVSKVKLFSKSQLANESIVLGKSGPMRRLYSVPRR